MAKEPKRKSLKLIFKEISPQLTIVSGRRRRKTLTEFQREPGVEERIRGAPAPRRVVREYDENWNPRPFPVCSICSNEVDELFPYGWSGKRLACAACLDRRRRLLDYKARVVAPRFSR